MKKRNLYAMVNEVDRRSARLASAETMLYIMLAAIFILFTFLAGAFLQLNTVTNFTVPPELSLSSICIVMSSVFITRLRKLKEQDKLQPFKVMITSVTALGLAFFICQFLGWQKLLHFLPSGYKNLIIILLVAHALHFFIAFILAFYITIKTYRISNGAELYIWFLNFRQQLFFKLTFIYWDFLGYLWIMLFVIIELKTIW
jgi:cytochrome c oxidase subunit 3